MPRAFVATLATLLALVFAPTATAQTTPSADVVPAGTILYVVDGDVIASTPDGSATHVVAAGGAWSAPSIADDGTVVAVWEGRELVRLTLDGTEIDSFTPSVNLGRIYDAQVSADGQLIAYASIALCNRPDGTIDSCRTTSIVHADGRSPDPLAGAVQTFALTWVPDRPTVITRGLDTLSVGQDETVDWVDRGLLDVNDLHISRDGRLLAVAGCDYEGGDFALECTPLIEFHRLQAPPPAVPVKQACFITNSQQVSVYDDVALAPDGTAVAFTERTSDERPEDATVTVLASLVTDPCSAGAELVLAQGATDLFWGAAPYRVDAGPIDPGTPGQPGSPDDPEGTIRIDGGGTTDPVGQSVATSFALFEDGTADRVVLATADRFPDALAGAALAGTRGPILLTPTAGPLDPRVAAEISRVTGGDGVVLVLGGEAAVNEPAAQQARAAAGNRPCTAPLPSSCRYAGTGREHTAALIAATVLAEHPGSRILLARGDAFADAITGGAYAARAGVPILLTPTTVLATATEQFLRDHPAVTEAVILGGEAAVSTPVATSLPVGSVRRVAGDDRTATSAAIATQLWQAEGLSGGGVVLINVRHDQGWQTALAAAVVSAATGAPQLGVEGPPASPTHAVLDAARALGGDLVVTAGGGDLVSPAQLTAVMAARG